ncbi:MAG TPA: NADPH:quinone reductase [Solirubrobacteraceae bacterium]|jgi:NADPH2:quinone reductase|nr:NADPH:quinone reductase [Solirubrobacteraceae bacterium]
MLAAFYAPDLSGGGALQVGELPTPEPGPGEVRVRMKTSGVNPTDWKSRTRPVQASTAPVQVPHHDGAGVIDAVGEGVEPARVGERVWTWFAAWQNPWGTAAEYSVIPAKRAVPLPEDASDELGAGLGIPALTAHRCLFADGPVEGRPVLVAAGAGAVGHAAIELARWAGARPLIATASNEDKAALARAAGADVVIDYRAPDAGAEVRAAAPQGVERIVEVALGANVELDLQACATGATVAVYASEATDPTIPLRRLMMANVMLRFVLLYWVPDDALAAAVAAISQALRAGALTSLPVHRFPLERIGEAHDAVRDGAVGKILVDLP